jgi:hypothetical protein
MDSPNWPATVIMKKLADIGNSGLIRQMPNRPTIQGA